MFSDCEIVNGGVPQVTVSGPLNLLLYVNDFSSYKNRESVKLIKEILQKTEEYADMNKLNLKTNKTELIFFLRINSDFGSIVYKNEHYKRVADILVSELKVILNSIGS